MTVAFRVSGDRPPPSTSAMRPFSMVMLAPGIGVGSTQSMRVALVRTVGGTREAYRIRRARRDAAYGVPRDSVMAISWSQWCRRMRRARLAKYPNRAKVPRVVRTPTTLATYFIWCQKRSLAMTASLAVLTDRLRSVGADTPAYPSRMRARRKSHEVGGSGRGLALTRRARHGVCRDRDPDLDLAGREPGRGLGRARAHGRSRRAERARDHRRSPPRRAADSHGRRPFCPGRYGVPGRPRAAAALPAARGRGG